MPSCPWALSQSSSMRAYTARAYSAARSNSAARSTPRGEIPCRAEAGSASAPSTSSSSAQPGDRFFRDDKRPIFLYDGVCRFCNAGVNFVLDNDDVGRVRMAALQSEEGRELLVRAGRSPDDLSSIVYIDEKSSAIKSEAVVKIGMHLNEPFPLMARAARFASPEVIRDMVYDLIASNRYNILGKTETCRLTDARFESRFLS